MGLNRNNRTGSITSEGGSEVRKSRKVRQANRRALQNWRRAKAAVTRKITEDMLGPQRRYCFPAPF